MSKLDHDEIELLQEALDGLYEGLPNELPPSTHPIMRVAEAILPPDKMQDFVSDLAGATTDYKAKRKRIIMLKAKLVELEDALQARDLYGDFE